MARRSRFNKTATLRHVTKATTGTGGIKPAETVYAEDWRFMMHNITPRDREALVTQYGFEEFAVVMFAEGDYVDGVINGDVIDVSATERWKILGASEIRGRDTSINPDCLSFIVQKAGDRPA